MAVTVAAEVLVDARSDLGEGPIWHDEREAVSWLELYDGRLNWLTLDGRTGEPFDVGTRVGAAVPTARGDLLLATDRGFSLLDANGEVELVAPLEEDTADWFLNDGKCDAAGRFWAGTVGVGEDGLAVAGAGSLYSLEPDGRVRTVLRDLSLANGLDWSPDGETFYFVDSFTWGIDAYAFDVSKGELGERRRVVDIPKEVGFVDGICTDTDGCIWAAVWGASEVRRYTPAGELDMVARVPVTQPTSCVFAGPDLDVLVITSASRHLDEEQRAAQPHAGSVFACRPGPTGSLPHRFRGGAAP